MNEAPLKALCKETKALIIVSEFEARRMPLFQLRAILNVISINEEEKKTIVDLVERDLRATGYPADQITAFLSDLVRVTQAAPKLPDTDSLLGTRKLRSPFSIGFNVQPGPGGGGAEAAQGAPAAPVQDLAPGMAAPAGAAPAIPTPVPRRHVFSFDAPIRSAPPPPKDVRQEPVFGKPVAGVQLAARPTVLVADDDKRVRLIFRLRIEEASMTVIECENGHVAWETIQKGDVSAVVLDMKMPGLHGLEVLANMKSKQINIPVVICSAYDQLQDDFVIKSYPLVRYLVKPVAPDALVGALKDLFALKAQQAQEPKP